MKRKLTSLLLALGAMLILCSGVLLATYQIRMHRAAQRNEAATAQMLTLFAARIPAGGEDFFDTNMPVLEIDGTDYVGLLEIPALGAAIPVTDQWSSGFLSASTGRFCGSAYDNTLVIGGPDHSGQFDFCDKIELGTVVSVTDMAGTQFSYTVACVDRSSRAGHDWLADGKHDLTLFCRGAFSFEYIAVRCDRIGK